MFRESLGHPPPLAEDPSPYHRPPYGLHIQARHIDLRPILAVLLAIMAHMLARGMTLTSSFTGPQGPRFVTVISPSRSLDVWASRMAIDA